MSTLLTPKQEVTIEDLKTGAQIHNNTKAKYKFCHSLGVAANNECQKPFNLQTAGATTRPPVHGLGRCPVRKMVRRNLARGLYCCNLLDGNLSGMTPPKKQFAYFHIEIPFLEKTSSIRHDLWDGRFLRAPTHFFTF